MSHSRDRAQSNHREGGSLPINPRRGTWGIRHTFALLAPGGRLVAVCANGPRQREELGEVCTEWIDLPAGSFKKQGTSVNTAIVVLDN